MIRGNVQDTSDDEFMRRGTSERQERIDNIKKNRIIIIITSHHMVKTDAGLNGLYIREINIYIRLYY